MRELRGPGEPFIELFNEQPDEGLALPSEFRSLYGTWPLPEPTEQPFTYVNFVMSHDGRVSFNEPGHGGGGDVSRRDPHDRWLMGLLRARADAVLVGGTSIIAAGNHVWTPTAVFPEDADAFAALRRAESRTDAPLLVVLTRSGEIPAHAPSLDNPQLPVLVASTIEGVAMAQSILGERQQIRYLAVGDTLDQHRLMHMLRQNYGINTLLCEAGPQVYGSLLQDGLINDAFVTISPIIIGRSNEQQRPSLIEGVAFDYEHPPQLRLLSVHRHGSYLYLHSRYER
jgi:5-amino-6-(5-phosphoribosylamino)uracil reductase